MPLTLAAPTPDDAGPWFDFVVAQQAAAYAGIVPDDFAARQGAYRPRWVPGLAAAFAEPGTARRVVAKADGALVGLASIVDAPPFWVSAACASISPMARL